jgi:hypothetical protein
MEEDGMSAKRVLSRIAIGCLVTSLLLPAGLARAQSAQSPTKPKSDLSGTRTLEDMQSAPSDQAEAASSEALAAPISTNDTTRWFRKTFVLVPTAGTSPLKLADGASSTEQKTTAQPAAPPVGVPGTVQNVRRADNG